MPRSVIRFQLRRAGQLAHATAWHQVRHSDGTTRQRELPPQLAAISQWAVLR